MLVESSWPYAVAVVAGGVLSRIVGPFIRTLANKNKEELDEGARIRKELRDQINYLTGRINILTASVTRLEQDVDQWKTKYYAVVEANLDLQHQCKQLLTELHRCNEQGYGEDTDGEVTD